MSKDEKIRKKSKKTPPCIDWIKHFPNGELPTIASGTPIQLIAIDTEYQSNYTWNTNLCLSYQFSAYDMQSGTYKTGIFYMDVNKQERLSLGELTKKILEEMQIPISSLGGYRIIYVAHFFTAEWAMLSDKKELYMKFEHIRKTLTTTKNPLKTIILDENNEVVNLWVDVRDTMLLLPEGYKSLEKASTFIDGYEKIDLPIEVKSNMYQFLQDDPEKFEEYALRDAEVTLKLFIKLQYLLNVVNGTETKMFSTLASATTSHFKLFSENRFQRFNDEGKAVNSKQEHNMQFDRLHSLYKQYESLADRSYMGGLNSSYHIGYCEGYTFIDIDFKNCYPSAMNLIKMGNFGIKINKPKFEKPSPFIEGLK
jgi:hypothetical protein